MVWNADNNLTDERVDAAYEAFKDDGFEAGVNMDDGRDNLCLACEEPTPDPYCPACTERYAALRDPDRWNPEKGGNRASDDYWGEG